MTNKEAFYSTLRSTFMVSASSIFAVSFVVAVYLERRVLQGFDPAYLGPIVIASASLLLAVAATHKKWYHGPRYISVIVILVALLYISGILIGLLTGGR